MKPSWLIAVLLLAALPTPAQDEDPFTLDDVVDSVNEWANENLDEDVLRALKSADQQPVRQFFHDLQKQLRGSYVLDLAALKDTAKTVLPILETYEETYPYAVWLRAHLDYLDVAEQMRKAAPPPRVEPGQPAKPAPNPAPQVERQVWISEWSERPWPTQAKPYVTRLKPIFVQNQVPPELVWLAEVESSFDPRARSPVGAAGLFQLTPATARRFGLKTTWPLDQRYKPEPSAGAAAKYLRYLHRHFGDWRLALAAYNAGEGTVQNLLKRHKAHDYDGIAEFLPAETQMYVPKVEAVLLRREGLKLSQLHLPSSPPTDEHS